MTRRLLTDELRRRGLKPAGIIEIEGREAVREAVAQGLGARHHVGRRAFHRLAAA